MNIYNISIKTLNEESRKETLIILEQNETFKLSTLNLKAKYPLSGFITGNPKVNDTLITYQHVYYAVGKVDALNNGLSEVELKRTFGKYPFEKNSSPIECEKCDRSPSIFNSEMLIPCSFNGCKPKVKEGC